MTNEKSERRDKSKVKIILWLILAAILLAIIGLLGSRCERELPQVTLLGDLTMVGVKKEIPLKILDAKSGIRRIDAILMQGGKKVKLLAKEFPREGYFGDSGPHGVDEIISIDMTPLKMEDGSATLSISVQDYSWWAFMSGNTNTIDYPITIDTKPPMVEAISTPRYIIPGGSGAAFYRVKEAVGKSGVVVNDFFYPGFPLAGFQDVFVAYIGLPYDTTGLANSFAMAQDKAGNEGRAAFGMILKKPKFRSDRINISDNFLQQKMPELLKDSSDKGNTLLDQYLYVNGTMRVENNQRIRDLCSSPLSTRMWSGIFLRLPHSSPEAGFADHRTYYYQERQIDEQVHLGIDLASLLHTPALAANHGIVIFADNLGIYGNTVILDHGQGLFSLYSHLSEIRVREKDEVRQGDTLGLTGTTGMAGGDHLHFAILVNGIFVTPIEWWDEHWLQDNILGSMPKKEG